jgi:hypothetical protein
MKKIIFLLTTLFQINNDAFTQVSVNITVVNKSNLIIVPVNQDGTFNFSTDESPRLKLFENLKLKDGGGRINPGETVHFYTKRENITGIGDIQNVNDVDDFIKDAVDIAADACGTFELRTVVRNIIPHPGGTVKVNYCNPFIGKSHYRLSATGLLKTTTMRVNTEMGAGKAHEIVVFVEGYLDYPAENVSLFYYPHEDNNAMRCVYSGTIEIPASTGTLIKDINEAFKVEFFQPNSFSVNENGNKIFKGNKGFYYGWTKNFNNEYLKENNRAKYNPIPNNNLELVKIGTTDSSYIYAFSFDVHSVRPDSGLHFYVDKKAEWVLPISKSKPPNNNQCVWKAQLVPKNIYPLTGKNNGYLKEQVFHFICKGYWEDVLNNQYDINGNLISIKEVSIKPICLKAQEKIPLSKSGNSVKSVIIKWDSTTVGMPFSENWQTDINQFIDFRISAPTFFKRSLRGEGRSSYFGVSGAFVQYYNIVTSIPENTVHYNQNKKFKQLSTIQPKRRIQPAVVKDNSQKSVSFSITNLPDNIPLNIIIEAKENWIPATAKPVTSDNNVQFKYSLTLVPQNMESENVLVYVASGTWLAMSNSQPKPINSANKSLSVDKVNKDSLMQKPLSESLYKQNNSQPSINHIPKIDSINTQRIPSIPAQKTKNTSITAPATTPGRKLILQKNRQ